MAGIDRRTLISAVPMMAVAAIAADQSSKATVSRVRSAAAGEIAVQATGIADQDTANLRTAFSAVADDATVRITGRELHLETMVEMRAKTGVEVIFDSGLIVRLANRAWTDPAAIVFRDCTQISLRGNPTIDCNWQEALGVACISTTGPNGWIDPKTARDFTIEATFLNCQRPGLLCRSVEGVTLIKPVLRGKAEKQNGIVVSRCNRVRVVDADIDGMQAESPRTIEINGAGIVISPGQVSTGEFDHDPAIAYPEPTTFGDHIRRVAPTGTSVWTLSIERDDLGGDGWQVYRDDCDFSNHHWYFHVAECGAAGEITADQISVMAVDSTPGSRTITVALNDEDGATPRNWNGEVVFIYGIHTGRMCRDVEVVGGRSDNNSGCGLFLLGCDRWKVTGFRSNGNRDLGYDAEWCRRGTFIDCHDRTTLGQGNCSAGLLYCLDDVSATDCSGNNPFVILGSGEIARNMRLRRLSGMTIVAHSMRAAALLLDGLEIEACALPDGEVQIRLHPAGTHPSAMGSGLIRHVRIAHNQIGEATGDNIRISNAEGIKIEDNSAKLANSFVAIDRSVINYGDEAIYIVGNRFFTSSSRGGDIPVIRFDGVAESAPEVVFRANAFSGSASSGSLVFYQDSLGANIN